MSVNLLETVVQNLGYAPLHKVDPNEQEVKEFHTLSTTEKLNQAAVPATLAAFSLFAGTEEGHKTLLVDLLTLKHADIFQGKETEIQNKIATYAGVSPNEASAAMNAITEEAIRITQQVQKDGASMDQVRTFIDEQRPTILRYLPASLQLGELLNYHGLDDRTHKMAGPFSNLAHLIEKKMSGGETL